MLWGNESRKAKVTSEGDILGRNLGSLGLGVGAHSSWCIFVYYSDFVLCVFTTYLIIMFTFKDPTVGTVGLP